MENLTAMEMLWYQLLVMGVATASKAQDSITVFGTIIGETTGKVLDYGVKSTCCRKYDIKLMYLMTYM